MPRPFLCLGLRNSSESTTSFNYLELQLESLIAFSHFQFAIELIQELSVVPPLLKYLTKLLIWKARQIDRTYTPQFPLPNTPINNARSEIKEKRFLIGTKDTCSGIFSWVCA
ncbi:hypothetical protein CK220_25915 [Mesorhizobium sp. WSM3860]|nr:hypothetical protein CK220_25915 [Mesorhizobium sp. WSM3860]